MDKEFFGRTHYQFRGENMSIKAISLLGSSSGRNAGDAALLAGIMDTVDDACKEKIEYEIPTINPKFVRTHYHNRVKPVSIMPWNASLKLLGVPTYQSIMRTDMSLVFDAVLFDRSLYNPLFNFLGPLSILLPKAKKRGKKLGFFNVTAGPVYTDKGKQLLRDLSDQMDFITVRDQDSYDILRDIGVTNKRVLVTADAALNVVPCSDERAQTILNAVGLGGEVSQEILGININAYIDTWASADGGSLGKERFLNTYAAALNRFLADTPVPVLFVSTQHHDVEITKELMKRVKCSKPMALLSNRDYNQYEIKGVLKQLGLLFAMRLHAKILASSELTPTIGLAYLPKCVHYYNSLKMPEWIMEFKDFSEESLYELISGGWRERSALRSKLALEIPTLKGKAKIAAELVASIHRGEDLDAIFHELLSPKVSLTEDHKPASSAAVG